VFHRLAVEGGEDEGRFGFGLGEGLDVVGVGAEEVGDGRS
jgi:hypothetical protein